MWMNTIFLLSATTFLTVDAFGVSPVGRNVHNTVRPPLELSVGTTTTDTDDLLKPSYDIEPLQVRIGHGFDIHRMAPIQDAGQPIVIGGVEITHVDQKVSDLFGLKKSIGTS